MRCQDTKTERKRTKDVRKGEKDEMVNKMEGPETNGSHMVAMKGS